MSMSMPWTLLYHCTRADGSATVGAVGLRGLISLDAPVCPHG